MPSRTRSSTSSAPSASRPSKLRRVAPPDPVFEDSDMDSDGDENDAALARYEPTHLDAPWAYSFEPNDRVWIRNHDKWIKGRIFPHSVPKLGSSDVRIFSLPLNFLKFTPFFFAAQNLTYWNVLYQDSFGHKLRKYFAPLLGELKPDTSAVRSLLRDAHWI
ncbi:hypothetical protein B0H17DRAFT_192567 [Mycena rosella]|uniref:Uncharacterized protein n=1 Tax=Mycena rosella TaxID=1033263 RepID=A0AAD7G6P8_MYCRO|nr:hypothetical protein B0H17DRAFT_192567 [Mycena rosella]